TPPERRQAAASPQPRRPGVLSRAAATSPAVTATQSVGSLAVALGWPEEPSGLATPENVAPASGPDAARLTMRVKPSPVGLRTPRPVRIAPDVGNVIGPLKVPSPVASRVPP